MNWRRGRGEGADGRRGFSGWGETVGAAGRGGRDSEEKGQEFQADGESTRRGMLGESVP